MHCGNCHKENPPTNVFCHSCGARLCEQEAVVNAAPKAEQQLVVCSRCDAANRPNMKFCKECGTQLGTEAAKPSIAKKEVGPNLTLASPDKSSSDEPEPGVSEVLCSRCGASGDLSSRFCKYCGNPFEEVKDSGAQMSPSISPSVGSKARKSNIQAQVVIILRNGAEGKVFPISEENTDIGSREGNIVLSDDPYLSFRHARITYKNGTFILKDLSSTNGIYVRVNESVNLADKDMILIGQQVLRFELIPGSQQRVGPASQHGVMVFGTPEAPRLARLVQYTTEGLERDIYYLRREDTVLGREQADVVFPDDPFLSRRHAVITMKSNPHNYVLRDLGSSNGTAMRCRNEHVLQHGDQFRLGRHLFRFDLLQRMREDHN